MRTGPPQADGLGVNIDDRGLLVHFGMPSSLDEYTQAIGCAGRDSSPAECLVIHVQGAEACLDLVRGPLLWREASIAPAIPSTKEANPGSGGLVAQFELSACRFGRVFRGQGRSTLWHSLL